MFFGVGNLILPPFLGFKAGNAWSLVIVGFMISERSLTAMQEFIPLAYYSLGWLIPAIVTFVIVNMLKKKLSFSNP